MLRSHTGAPRGLRWGLLGLAAVVTYAAVAVDPADARSRRKRWSPRATQTAQTATETPRYADIVVDANTGSVLHATNPDALRHPASLTKIMTLYLLFERLEAGKLKLDSSLEVSAHAAAQSPTKLGLRDGQTIKVEDAIKGIVTRSANDAAVVLAENIAGDEEEFARLMTRKAQALGMSRTVYKNAPACPTTTRSPPRAISRPSGAPSRNASRAIIPISRPARSPSAATRSATTITCLDASKVSTASRPATSMPQASTSSPRCTGGIAISLPRCSAAAAPAAAMRA